MAAVLIPAIDPLELHRLRLPPPGDAGPPLEEVRYGVGQQAVRGGVLLEAGDWLLRLADLRDIRSHLESVGLRLVRLRGRNPRTLVAASALGLEGEWAPPSPALTAGLPGWADSGTMTPLPSAALTIHRGTLRAGDHLQVEGSVLLLGDVNPGARVTAGGHVLVWGRLRGVAHAGAGGAPGARIVAMQLQPVQLRIGSVVARGPEESPPAGQAEEASLVAGEIRIEAASPTWPLAD
jgi:septum site-determining protein MinC